MTSYSIQIMLTHLRIALCNTLINPFFIISTFCWFHSRRVSAVALPVNCKTTKGCLLYHCGIWKVKWDEYCTTATVQEIIIIMISLSVYLSALWSRTGSTSSGSSAVWPSTTPPWWTSTSPWFSTRSCSTYLQRWRTSRSSPPPRPGNCGVSRQSGRHWFYPDALTGVVNA